MISRKTKKSVRGRNGLIGRKTRNSNERYQI